ncbi:uncharacterized protein LOC144650905 isoform X1 [Oculina patagonica]
MALFRGVRRIFRRRLFLFFVLILIGTVFLCSLEVFKYKGKLRKSGLSDPHKITQQHYKPVGKRQHQRQDGDAKDSKFYSVSDGSRKNYGEAMEDEKEEDILDKRIISDDEVSIEEERENEQNNEGNESFGEYEDDFDSVDRNNKERNKKEKDQEEDKEEELKDKEEQIEQQRREREDFGKGEEEQEEEEFEMEGEEETNEEEKVKPLEDENEELKQEQSYETKVVHEDEKYKKENTAVPDEENEYFQHNRDEEEQDETEEHKELNEQEEQDEEEEEYHMLVNQTEGLKSVQSTANYTITESEKDEESMEHDNSKEALIHKTQSYNTTNENNQENEGVPLNEIKENEDLTIEDEGDEENDGTPSNENQSREEMANTSEIAEKQTQNNIVDYKITAQEKTMITESVSNRSDENVDKEADQNITNKHTSLSHAEHFEDERNNSSEMLESPSYEELKKDDNPEVEDVNNKNVTRTNEENGDANGSDMVERSKEEDISEYSINEEENIDDRKGQEEVVTEDDPSTRTGQHDDNNGTESVTAEGNLGQDETNSTKKDERGADAAVQDKESNDENNLIEKKANRTHEEDEAAKSQSDNEMNTHGKDKEGETIEKEPEMNKVLQLPTNHGGAESAVKLNENGNMTEAREMVEDKTAINGEVEQDSFKDKNDENETSTESTEQESPEIEKNSDSDKNELEANKAEKESLEEDGIRKEKERTNGNKETHQTDTRPTDTKNLTAEPTDQKVTGSEQKESIDNEHGTRNKTRTSSVELGIGQNKNNTRNEEGKLDTEERKQINEGEARENGTGNEYKDKMRNVTEFESKNETKNEEKESKEENYEEEKENNDEENNRDKTTSEDVEGNKVEDVTESNDAGKQTSTVCDRLSGHCCCRCQGIKAECEFFKHQNLNGVFWNFVQKEKT